jgi:Fe-S-cluster containining protein
MTTMEHFASPPSFPLSGGENLCRLCSRDNSGCCRTDPQLAPFRFPLSVPEWRRLSPYAALASLAVPADGESFAREERRVDAAAPGLEERETFSPSPGSPPPGGDAVSSSEQNVPDFIASLCDLFPGEKKRLQSLFPAGGRHSALRIRADGACVFLGRGGCRLPRRVRPWYCLLFPAWVIKNSLAFFFPPDCLIAQKARSPAHGVVLLNERPAHLLALYSLLRRDWELDAPGYSLPPSTNL